MKTDIISFVILLQNKFKSLDQNVIDAYTLVIKLSVYY